MRLTVSSLLALAPALAWAQGKPVPEAVDPHVFVVDYDENRTYPITIAKNMQCVVTINPNEVMVRTVGVDAETSVGAIDPKDAKQDPFINNIPLFGAKVGTDAVTVISHDGTGHEHVYVFMAHVVAYTDGDLPKDACLKYVFKYNAAQQVATLPADQQRARQAQKPSWKEQLALKKQQVAEARLQQDLWYGPQNHQFKISGKDSDIAPPDIIDNTRMTGFRFPGNMQKPTILRVLDEPTLLRPEVCDGKKPTDAELHAPEEALNQWAYDDIQVVQTTSPHFRLRSGNKVLDVWGCAYDPVGTNPGTGTNSPDVVRRVISADR